MTEYKLINPKIEGTMKTRFLGNNPTTAAKEAWTVLSKNFTNFIPKFAFTLVDDNNKQSHFVTRESEKNGEVDFVVEEIKKVTPANEKALINKGADQQQKVLNGGSRDDLLDDEFLDDDDDDFDDNLDDCDIYGYCKRNSNLPISLFWYYPSIYPLDYVNIPTWNSYSTPFVQLVW